MPRYYEQLIEGRYVINATGDETQGRIVDAVSAPCWLEAKRQFGYPLSAKDEAKLDEFYQQNPRKWRKHYN